eukprot:763019-Hanusia_phi.AAC.1
MEEEAGGEEVLMAGAGAGSLTAWIILLFSAIGPGAIADVMQARAQEKNLLTVYFKVKASEANVILSAEPLWAGEIAAPAPALARAPPSPRATTASTLLLLL